MTMTNTLGYYNKELISAEKSFIVKAPWDKNYKIQLKKIL